MAGHEEYELVLRSTVIGADEVLSVEEVAALTGADPNLIVRFCALGLVEQARGRAGLYFRSETVLRVRKILRLRHDLGVTFSSMPLVLELLDRIDELEATVARLQTELTRYRSR